MIQPNSSVPKRSFRRRSFVQAAEAMVGSVALLCGPQAVSAADAPDHPNVIFILTDDLGYGDVGVFFQNARAAAGNPADPWHLTPHIDSLAAEGVEMFQHYCPAPVCAPSRASLLLGVTQGHANVRDNQFDKALEDNHTLATVMDEAGYATVAIGKWGLQGDGSRWSTDPPGETNPATWIAFPTKRGFDDFFGYARHSDGHEHYPKEGVYEGTKQVWDGTNDITPELDKCYTADLWTAWAKQWIVNHEATNASQPFFMYLAYDTPHAVLELPTQAYPAGSGVTGGVQWLGTPGHMINTASGTVDSYIYPQYANATYDDDNNPATPEVPWPDIYKRYATSVQRIDDGVGDLMQLLRDLNIASNTFVVFSSDNGPSIESYVPNEPYAANFFDSFGPFDGIKRDCWEGGVRVPTIACWPGHIPAGSTNNLPSGFWDWMPTFASLAGLPAPARSDGVSLLPSLTDIGTQRTPTVYVEYYQNGTTPSYSEFVPAHRGRIRKQMQVVRLGDYVGVRYNITSQTDDFEIYNVMADPQEATNLDGNPAYTNLEQEMKDTVLQERRPNSTAPRPYDDELVPASHVSPLAPGIEWSAYNGPFPWVPQFAPLTPVRSGETNAPTLAVRPQNDNFGLLFTGYIDVPTDGNYTFYLTTDAGALLRIHEATVIDADFGYVGGTERSASILLKAGWHPFRLYYVHGTNGTPALDWEWSGPNFAKQPISANSLFHVGVAPPGPPIANPDTASTTQGTSVLINVMANDFDDGTPQPLSIQSVTQPFGGTNQIVSGKILYTPATNFLGQDHFQYRITDGSNTATAVVTVNVYFTNSDYMWFPFNQTSGLTTTEAGGALSASLFGFSDATSPWVAGRFGRGLGLSGSGQFATVNGFPGILGTNPRTVTAWIKTTVATGPIAAWGPKTTGEKWIFLVWHGFLRAEDEGGYVVGSTTLTNGLWHHVAFTWQDTGTTNITDVKLYVDGALETFSAQSAQAVDTQANGDMKIGCDMQNRYFHGTIDELRVYKRALSASEIAALAVATNQCADAWYYRYYGTATPDWNGDSDGDGFSQFAEYAFGGDPRVPDEPLKVQASVVDGHLQIAYPRLISGTSDLIYKLEDSSDLQNWTPLAGTEIGIVPVASPVGYEMAAFEAANPISSQSPQFVRVRASQ